MDAIQSTVELPQAVIDALNRGAIVVTGNQRAARTLRRSFDRRNQQMGLAAWSPAEVMAWDAWIASLWRDLLLEGHVTDLLLSRSQEQTVWRKIISADHEIRDTLRSPDSLAELAASAWLLLARYNGMRLLHGLFPSSFETRAFQRWAAEFEKRCRNEKWLSIALLEDTLKAAFDSESLKLHREIVLIGFDEVYPVRQSLIDSIRSSGLQVKELDLSLSAKKYHLVRASNEQEEISGAGRWVRTRLEEFPESRIAIIVPALETRRAVIDRTFRKILAPHLEAVDAPNHAGPYEFSVGVKLADTAPVKSALDLLRWTIAPLPLEKVSSLLVSPLFAKAEKESNSRASFDAFELRKAKLLRPEIKLSWIIETVVASRRRAHMTNLLAALRSMERAAKKHSVENALRTHTEWADSMRDLLEVAQWGHGSEDSVEFQTHKRWESTLDELATLDFDGSRVTFEHALRSLEWLAWQTTFAPESRDTPVQVVGPLEAAGSNFDALWFLGAGDLTWPIRPSANPLLPWALQIELGIPGVQPANDDLRSHHVFERIARSAETIVFSHAVETSAGKQRPTPSLERMQLSVMDIEEVAPKEPKVAAIALEDFSDSLPIAPVPDSKVLGGADILRLQAACGFRAFAERRLGSNDLKNMELGMDATERGNIVHRTLECFWNEVGTQTALNGMSPAEFTEVLGKAIEYGLKRATESSSAEWDGAYVEVQRKRLWNLLIPWFDVERKRDNFSVKLSEKDFPDVRIGPLRLSVRVDRVDTSEDGEVIIDYKASAAKPLDWQSDRPEAPQLPLYAVLSTETQPEIQLADVAFGRIRVGNEMALDGFSGKITAGGRKKSPRRLSMPEQLDQWKRILTDLAEGFHRGDARVDPKKYPLTCTYCAQRIFCRLDPAAFDEDMDDEATIDTGNG